MTDKVVGVIGGMGPEFLARSPACKMPYIFLKPDRMILCHDLSNYAGMDRC
jgi:hypothetical protein